jgi:hypothetical protein
MAPRFLPVLALFSQFPAENEGFSRFSSPRIAATPEGWLVQNDLPPNPAFRHTSVILSTTRSVTNHTARNQICPKKSKLWYSLIFTIISPERDLFPLVSSCLEDQTPLSCKNCKSTDLRTSRLRWSDLSRLLLLQYPVRCWKCYKRDFASIFQAFKITKEAQKRRSQAPNGKPSSGQ